MFVQRLCDRRVLAAAIVLGAFFWYQWREDHQGLCCPLPKSQTLRTTWRNQLGNQVVNPLQRLRPTAAVHAGELTGVCNVSAAKEPSIYGILRLAHQHKLRVKAVGSGHSYSPVATTADLLVDTHGLDKLAHADNPIFGQQHASWLKSSAPPLVVVPGLPPWYNEPFDPSRRALVEVEGGITLSNLVQQLKQSDLGLMNMGGFDGQTLAGAISTSTHGSGLQLGPFSDMVRSILLITDGKWNGTSYAPATAQSSPDEAVRIYRIEPTHGITDPSKWVERVPLSDDERFVELIQDDTAFYAATCSMGAFGIIYSVTIEVMQMYYLTENRMLTTLDKVVADYWRNSTKLQTIRHVEFIVHPYPTVNMVVNWTWPWVFLSDFDASNVSAYHQQFQVLVTERRFATGDEARLSVGKLRRAPRDPITAMRSVSAVLPALGAVTSAEQGQAQQSTSNWWVELRKWVGGLPLLSAVLGPIMRYLPQLTPVLIDGAMGALVDSNYTSEYYNIFDLGVNGDAGFAAEVGLSTQDPTGSWDPSTFIQAVDTILANAQNVRKLGLQYQTSPFAVRFVHTSQALLSMMHARDTCMIELDMLKPTYAGLEIMGRFEKSMVKLGGIMHWGLSFDTLNGGASLRRLGGENVKQWLEAYKQFNLWGTFDNVFTEHMGFREHASAH